MRKVSPVIRLLRPGHYMCVCPPCTAAAKPDFVCFPGYTPSDLDTMGAHTQVFADEVCVAVTSPLA